VLHLHGLRVAAGARGEDHHERVVRPDLTVRRQLDVLRGQRGPFATGRVQHPDTGQVDAVEQVAVGCVGDQDLTVDEGDIAGEGLAAPSVVDAAQHIAAECCGGHRRQHVGSVGHQHADVQGSGGIGDADERGGLGLGHGDVLAPRPTAVAMLHSDGVLFGPLTQQLLECVRHGSPRFVALTEQIRESVYHFLPAR
jgi:hypothetical protein